MIKKLIISFVLTALMLICFSACGDDFDTNTIKFYRNINTDSYYYKATVTENGETYTYSQAIKNGIVTTIEDREGNVYDGYVIYNGNQLHTIDFNEKRYDTEITASGVKFVFTSDNVDNYNYPADIKDETLDGNTYRCETFKVVDANGDTVGENKYYYTSSERLAAVIWLEDGNIVRTMKIEEYTDVVPEDIYFAPPEDFKPRTLTQTEEIPIEDVFGDYLSNIS